MSTGNARTSSRSGLSRITTDPVAKSTRTTMGTMGTKGIMTTGP